MEQAQINAAVAAHFSRLETCERLQKAVTDGVTRGVADLAQRAPASTTRLTATGPDRPLAAVAGGDSLAKASGNPVMDRIEENLAKAAESLAATNAGLGLTAPAPAAPPTPAGERLKGETPAERLARYDAIRASGTYVPEVAYERVKWAADVGPLIAGAEPRDFVTDFAGARAPYVDGRADADAELKAARGSGNAYRIAAAERAANDAVWRHALRPK